MKPIMSLLLAGSVSAIAVAWAQMPAADHADQSLTVDEIVAKNAAARGGDDAWRKVQAMMWAGHVDSANAPTPSVPFVLALKRPSSTRFELTAMNQHVLRMFDGKAGWKIRPSSDGMPDVQAYSPSEVRYASEEQVIDGPLLDHAAKGIAVSLEGNEMIDDRKTYRLLVTLPSGAHRHVWVDAQSFLDVKYDREAPNLLTGKPVTVEVSYRDYHDVDGLKLPYTIESGVVGAPKKDKLVIDRVSINPPLNDNMFVKPVIAGRRGSVTVGVEGAPPTRSAFRQMP
ncbi:hypothetical protein [Paraburkholderia sp. HP33-1]|uniref:hypothetical protein n=1 Tax=Paraburkholderia sp. HP33-1 TaxID=2883243 RepID=UPI001F486B23|nr:hypothetical protein [Paraburkholderia sp. HP33-1]